MINSRYIDNIKRFVVNSKKELFILYVSFFILRIVFIICVSVGFCLLPR